VRRLDHVVLDVRPEAVLRAEDGAERQPFAAGQPIDDVGEAAIELRVIADHADAQAVEPRRAQQNIRADPHARRRRLHCR
jgi:hypothetical protein